MIPAKLRAAFEGQARSCATLGSPFMDRLNRLFASQDWPAGPIRDRIFAWDGDVSSRGASVPLRLAGALHALRLQEDADLARVYPPQNAGEDDLWQVVAQKLVTKAAFINRFIDSPPQTNEVRRAAVLVAAGHWLAARYGLPMRVLELGASAGLNLMWDRFAVSVQGQVFGPAEAALTLVPEWQGPLPPQTRPVVERRRGVDLNPLDPNEDALRLRAYLWPDQPERMTLTNAAIACSTVSVDKADAIEWLDGQLEATPGQLRLIYHTIAWQYFPHPVQAKGTALIEGAGAAATANTPLAWFGMEADDNPDGAGLSLRLWPGNETLSMGRVDFHGRWVKWAPPS